MTLPHNSKRSRLTNQQITYAIKQAELGTPIPKVCRMMGIADATSVRGARKPQH